MKTSQVPSGTLVEFEEGRHVHATGRVFRFMEQELQRLKCPHCGGPLAATQMHYNGKGDFFQFAFCPACVTEDKACILVPPAMRECYDNHQDIQ